MYRNLLVSWTRFVISRPGQVLGVFALITMAALYFAVTRFSMNSDNGRLIQQDTSWKVTYDKFMDTFPQYLNNTFVVVSGDKIASVSNVSRALELELASRNDVFKSVYGPANDDFLDTHALLFVDADDLDTLVSNLADAQPILTAVARDESLRGLFGLLTDALSGEEDIPDAMARFTNLLADNIDITLGGNPSPVTWRDEMVDRDSTDTIYSIIFVQGQFDFEAKLPSAEIIRILRSTIENFEHPEKDLVDIRLTGQIPLDHGEVESAMSSARLAGAIAVVFLMFILGFGVGSLRIIAATYLAMTTGLIWTAAYAILTVGQYNTISIIFLVMFIGLGVDFAIHLSLRYQEDLYHQDKQSAIISTNRDLGPAITLCGITSAIGFLSFVPTKYVGLAELGIISGGGMIIAVFVSLTLIPAFFAVVKTPVEMPRKPYVASLSEALDQHRHSIIAITFAVAGLAIFIARDAYFDMSTLALKDQHSEAMETFRELQAEDIVTDYSLNYVAADRESADLIKNKLLALETVSEVKTPNDYVPTNQEEKLLILEDAQIMLASTFYAEATDDPYSSQDRDLAIQDLIDAAARFLQDETTNEDLRQAIAHLHESLIKLRESDNQTRGMFEENVIAPMLKELKWLERAINVSQIVFNDLPEEMRDRLVTKKGEVLLTITPSKNIVPTHEMREFATDVQSVISNATGRLTTELGIGEIVIGAFQKAIFIAVTCILVVLLLALRSVVDTILVFIPLVITAMITFASSVLLEMPLNMANVVVIPLIFGLGVDNGIHVVQRFHESSNLKELVHSSTPRAVFLSTLTTMGTFGALSFSDHQGIYSIGVLLTFALGSLMVLTLISLPALLAVFSTTRAAR